MHSKFQNRNPQIDCWRGFLIVMVVVGHAIGMAEHFSNGFAYNFLEYSFKIIYVFHIPAFFFLSGMLWSRRDGDRFIEFVKKKFYRLIVPYLVFGMLSGMIYYFLSGHFFATIAGRADGTYVESEACISDIILSIVHAGGLPNNGIMRANSVLWFLPALFSAEVIYWVVDRITKRLLFQFAMVAIIYCLCFFVPLNLPWGLSRALNLLMFLTLGRWAHNLCQLHFSRFTIWGFVLVYCLLCVVTPNYWIVHSKFSWYIAFDLLAIFGVVTSYFITRDYMDSQMVREVGASTMGIMLMHKFVIVGLQSKVIMIGKFCQSGLAGALLAVVFTTAAAIGLSMVMTRIFRYICPFILGEIRRNRNAARNSE